MSQTSRCRPPQARARSAGATTIRLGGIAYTVAPLAAGRRREHTVAGQPVEQQPRQPAAVAAVTRPARGTSSGRTRTAPTSTGSRPRSASGAAATDPRVRRRRTPGRERRHALRAVGRPSRSDHRLPSSPAVPAEPLVVDRPLGPHPFQHAAHPAHQRVVARGRRRPSEVSWPVRCARAARPIAASRRLPALDLDGHRAGQFQGAADAGCSPNSSAASSASRLRTRVRTAAGTAQRRRACQNGANASRSARSGGEQPVPARTGRRRPAAITSSTSASSATRAVADRVTQHGRAA